MNAGGGVYGDDLCGTLKILKSVANSLMVPCLCACFSRLVALH